MSGPNIGTSIDDFLKEQGVLKEAQATAIKEVVEWQVARKQITSSVQQAEKGSKAQK